MKLMWVLLAMGGISLWVIPNTVSQFSGGHTYYNIDANDSQVPCIKCHGDIQIELHTGFIHNNFTCSDCHRVQKGVQYASGDDAYERLIYINVTPLSTSNIRYRVLATSIGNFQSGNFPKSISGEITIDQWAMAGNDQAQFRDANNQYAGNMTPGETGVLYNYADVNGITTYSNGAPKDTDLFTQNMALDPRKINVNSDPYGSDDLTGAGSRVVTPGTLAHAASIVPCAECHSNYLNQMPDTIHEAFIKYGMEHNTSENCIACHTSTAVSINWTRPSTIAFETSSDGYNIIINRTYPAFGIRIETFGNRTGDVIAVSNVTVI
ncbi:Cytochrome c7 c [uncultured archaeon]|nr:Cytochrome c7 c [uncultured archaeon]